MPTAHLLLHCMGVGGYGCHMSCSACYIGITFCVLRNSASNSASAVDAATCFKILHRVCTAPLRKMGLLLSSLLPKKNSQPLCFWRLVCCNMQHPSVAVKSCLTQSI